VGWLFVQRQLAPLVENNVEQLINRPVELGRVERFSLQGLRFGPSEIPETPTEPNRVELEAIDVAFNPLRLLFNRRLELDLVLRNPEVYAEQKADGGWVSLELEEREPGPIEVDLQVVRLRDADVVLVPRGEEGNLLSPIEIALPQGRVQILGEDNERLRFALEGELASGGEFEIEGERLAPTGEINLAVSGSNVGAAQLDRLIQLPLNVQGGRVAGNLELQIAPEQPLEVFGVATLNNVTARVPQLPQPFAQSNGRLRFKGTQIRLENVTTRFGQIPAVANGAIDTQAGYSLSARTEPVPIEQVLQTFNLENVPVEIVGDVQTALQVTGELEQPQVSGEVATTTPTQVDRLTFRSASAGFKLVGSSLDISDFQAQPAVGGSVRGNGEIQLGEDGGLRFAVQANNVPAEALASQYGIDVPIPLGTASAEALIFGPLGEPENLRATGSARLNAAGGTLTADSVQVGDGRWQGLLRANNLAIASLVPQLPPEATGRFDGTFNVSGSLDRIALDAIRAVGSGQLAIADGTVRATNVRLRNGQLATQLEASGVQLAQLAEVPPPLSGPLSGQFDLAVNLEDVALSEIRGTGSGRLNLAGGTVTARNVQLAQGRWQANLQASGVQLGRLAPQLPPQLQSPFSGTFDLAGSLEEFSLASIRGSGSGRLNVADGTVELNNVQLAQGRWQTNLQASGVRVGELVPQLPPQVAGTFTGAFDLAGSLEQLSPAAIRGSGGGRLNIAGGTVTATDLQLAEGRWQTNLRATGVQLGQFVPQLPNEAVGAFTGAFNLAGSLEQLSPEAIRGSGSGRLNVADGTVALNNVQFAQGRWQTNLQASGVQVGQLVPQLPGDAVGGFTGALDLAGSLEQLSLTAINASGSGRLNVAGGTLTATDLQLSGGNLQAQVIPSGIELGRFSEELEGEVSGRVDLSTSLAQLTPAAIARATQATGQLAFSEGIAIIDRPLTTAFRWTGEGLEIQQATAEGFSASGFVGVNPNQLDEGLVAAIGAFDLDVAAADLNLQNLSAFLPETVADVGVVGLASFDGRIAGTLTAPNVMGDVRLRNFAVDGLAFESVLTGQVSAVPGRGVTLDLTGTNEQIQLALGPDYRPISFLVQDGDAIARGQRQGNVFQASAQNFPLDIIQELAPTLPPIIATQPIAGEVSGQFAIDLNTFDIAVNNLEVTGPILAAPRGVEQPAFNELAFTGQILQTPQGPRVRGQLQIEQGQLPIVLAALRVVEGITLPREFEEPVDIAALPEETPEEEDRPQEKLQLQALLRRLSEIEVLIEQEEQREEEAAILPPLTELAGTFSGTVDVDGSLARGIEAQFDLQGQNWEWGPYNAERVIAEGSFQNGILTLLPLRFEAGNPENPESYSFATFSGSLGGEEQSGRLQLENIPLSELQPLLQDAANLSPGLIGFTGSLDATAILSGSRDNPQARGVVTVTDATLNQTSVQSAEGSFRYNNARLTLDSSVLIAGDEPLTISGSVPYKLPFASVEPESEQLNLNVDVADEGLALVNILTRRQVSWVEGEGNVQLAISGTPGRPIARGIATIENATIDALALPQPLTDVEARVLFDFDTIEVQTFDAQFSDGTITAAGALPISQPEAQDNPLRVNIGELALDFRGLYKGGVRGDVVVTGSAREPVLGGEVSLFDGRVQIAEAGAGGNGGTGDETDTGNPLAFNNLQLILDRDVQITNAPILNFLAEGTLTINGNLNDIEPNGIITLKRGQVNLFTTQFRLIRDRENTAEFTPDQGLDPILDVQLVASVPETTRQQIPTDPLSPEIADLPATGFGSVQTIRVVAEVEGPASEIVESQNLELTSTPARSETEIIALLGGGFVETLGRGDSTLGLANLAGSALLGTVGDFIGNALGLRDFRLFPTTVTNEDERSSALGIAAEVGINLGRDFSVSVLKELTTDEPPQLNLRYRLSEEFLLRGGTDLSGESRVLLEYERRF
jgi:translocation and assembly module TamB